jgi:hypothetical protein
MNNRRRVVRRAMHSYPASPSYPASDAARRGPLYESPACWPMLVSTFAPTTDREASGVGSAGPLARKEPGRFGPVRESAGLRLGVR